MESSPADLSGRLIVLLLLCTSVLSPARATQTTDQLTDRILTLVDNEVEQRLASLDQSFVEHRLDPAVRSIIRRYVELSPDLGARVVGRSVAYFPLFDRLIADAGLPAPVRYLAIAESALVLHANSRVGAAGLWQLMPATARSLGLYVDDKVDERLDVYRSTEAAMRYIKQLYRSLGDWGLVLAAYNAGPGRVRGALRKSRHKDYWNVRRYLPRETQLYVPAFIAATYLAEFYALHAIEPDLPSLDEQLITTLPVEQPLSFYRIAQVTGLSVDLIARLNPAYLQGQLPGYKRGHYLTLPRRVAPALKAYLEQFAAAKKEPALPFYSPFLPYRQLRQSTDSDSIYQLKYFTVESSGELATIADSLRLSAHTLAVWNAVCPHKELQPGQRLAYFRPRELVAFGRDERVEPAAFLPGRPLEEVSVLTPRATQAACEVFGIRLRLNERMHTSRLLRRWPALTWELLTQYNDLDRGKFLAPGTVLYLDR